MAEQAPFRVASAGTIWLEENYYFPDVDLNSVPDDYSPPEDRVHEITAGSSAFSFCRTLGGVGIHSTFFGVAGDPIEPRGDQLESLVSQERMITTHLIRQPGTTTGLSKNMTGKNGSHLMAESGTANQAFSTETILLPLVEAARTADVLYAGGCLKLESFQEGYRLLPDLISETTRLVVDHGRIPKNLSPELADAVKYLALHANYYLPSEDKKEEEFCTFWGVDTIEEGLWLLHQKAPNLTVVVKAGEQGAYYYDSNMGVVRVDALPVAHITRRTGAGDNFNARFILEALANNRPILEAIKKGHETAAAHIQGHSVR